MPDDGVLYEPEAAIRVVPYDPSWVEQFEREKAMLEPLLLPWRHGPIEHIGSTAVPGLCAKPVIDVMVGVTSLQGSEPAKEALERAARPGVGQRLCPGKVGG